MTRPIVGIISNQHLINDQFMVHGAAHINVEAIAKVTGCLPLIIPTAPEVIDIQDLLNTCDGFLLTGGRANVHPCEYGEEETEAHERDPRLC
jgi:putative glutamine amidotransferase